MKRIESFQDMKQGDMMYSIDENTGDLMIYKFVCPDPFSGIRSFFINEQTTEAVRVFNSDVHLKAWYEYKNTSACWEEIHQAKIEVLQGIINRVKTLMFRLRS